MTGHEKAGVQFRVSTIQSPVRDGWKENATDVCGNPEAGRLRSGEGAALSRGWESCRHRFTSQIQPPYMCRSSKVAESLPILYLRGPATGAFPPRAQTLLGEDAVPSESAS